jgi:transposase
VETTLGWTAEIVSHPPQETPRPRLGGRRGQLGGHVAPPGFHVLPRRWVVEQTFGWIDHNRRMSKDYERLCATDVASKFEMVACQSLPAKSLPDGCEEGFYAKRFE